jgi:hypothetical protein
MKSSEWLERLVVNAKSQQAWIREAGDEVVLNNVHKKKKIQKIRLKKNFTSK